MSRQAVENFYRELERNPDLRNTALALQQQFHSQEEVMQAFIDLGNRYGFQFTDRELVEHIYACGREEK